VTAIRICFIGDSITLGTGDETTLGWPGRLGRAAWSQGHEVTVYNLGVRGETSGDIRLRWRNEAARRLPSTMNCALVFAFGLNDCAVENNVKQRVALEQTVLNSRSVLDEARAWLPSLFVGPLPVDNTHVPRQLIPGKQIRIFNEQIEKTNRALACLMAELNVPFLDLFTSLSGDSRWREAMKLGDGIHPPTQGYDLVAQMIEGWRPWRRLLDGDGAI
jgi:acyl-CoA thioesterase-1